MNVRATPKLLLSLLLIPACADDAGEPSLDPAECDIDDVCDGEAVVGNELEEEEDEPGAAARSDDDAPWSDPIDELAGRNTMEGGAFRDVWFPDGDVPYFSDSAFSNAERDAIDDAMDFLEEHTPIDVTRFTSAGTSRRLRFRAVNGGCGMAYGYWNENRSDPTIRLGSSCRNEGTVHHEMFHALGFAHEFQRPDRDDHAAVCFNLDPFNYGKLGSAYWPDRHAMLSPFDFESITSLGYTGSSGCVSGIDGTFSRPQWRGEQQPLSRHDINSLYRVYAEPNGVSRDDENFGNAIAAGDFDDDGIEDLAVVAREENSTNASIRLYFYKGVELDDSEGGAGRLFEPWFDQSLNFTPSRSVKLSAAAGDFDGDGIPELAVGDPSYGNGSGRVYVVTVNEDDGSTIAPWGRTGLVSIERISATDVGLQLGRAHGFGASLATGRLTDLDHDDLVIGAPTASAGSQSGSFSITFNAGGAVVHLPGADETASVITWNPDYNSFSLSGQLGGSNEFGASLTTLPFFCDHDPNAGNDQFDTFVAGAPGYDADAGAIYVHGCSRTSSGTPIAPSMLRRVTHWQDDARYGKAIAGFRAAPIGGEMEWFLAVGTPGYESGGVDSGKVYLDSFDRSGNKTFVGSYRPSNTSGGDKFGMSVAVFQGGDIGIVDRRFVHLAIGMTRTDNSSGIDSGKVYLWRPFNTTGINNTATVWSPTSASSGMRFGRDIVAVHSDSPSGGFAMTAPRATANGHDDAGRVTVRLDRLPDSTGWSSARQELDVETGADKPPLN